ncbi:SGNH hydrolase-type esterase domain-containing protein [Xylariaceae sp. FL0662B]|nr:SGNH hydrolase-type esterase domain-containing protein [Xylariaceae sp. FL0662B]
MLYILGSSSSDGIQRTNTPFILPSHLAPAIMAKTPINILCIGDSLTVGSPSMHPYGLTAASPAMHPYAVKLKERLEEAFPEYDVEYEVDGKEGDQVTQGVFLKRVAMSWAVADRRFDWTIVLGGSNDLTRNKRAGDIIEALQGIWDIPLSEGGKVLAMTIPECRANTKKTNDQRNEVNTAIKEYSNPNFFFFDLCEAIPYHAMDVIERSRYWDKDGVHLSREGYDLMGEMVADELIRIMTSLPI